MSSRRNQLHELAKRKLKAKPRSIAQSHQSSTKNQTGRLKVNSQMDNVCDPTLGRLADTR